MDRWIIQNDNWVEDVPVPPSKRRSVPGGFTRGKYIELSTGPTVPNLEQAKLYAKEETARDVADKLNKRWGGAWEPSPHYSVVKIRVTYTVVTEEEE